jgi:probable addiction module antidote protein
LVTRLKDPKEAAGLLNGILEENDWELFLMALRDVAHAHGGLTALAKKTKLSRPSLYRMLSGKGNPELTSLDKILKAFGLRISMIAIQPVKKRKAG